MRKVRRYALLTLVLAAVVASLSTLVAPTHTPYQSALSVLGVSPAYAAGCPDKACNKGIDCVSAVGYKCIRFNGKGCTATACS